MRIALALVAAVAAVVAVFVLKPPAQRPASTEKIDLTPDRLARGKYLVEHVTPCLHCHSSIDDSVFGGDIVPGTEGMGGYAFGPSDGVPGEVQAQNITPAGLGDWTDGEILRAMREGVRKDGTALFPMMPYPQFAIYDDDDARAIVAYLRTLKPVPHAIKPRALAFPVNLLVKLEPRPLAGPVRKPTDHLAYGKYLATVAGCVICHTPMDNHGQRIAEREFAGGWEMKGGEMRVITSNITPAEGTWMSQATKEEFIGRFRVWQDMPRDRPAKGRLTAMPWRAYAGMADQDLGAIYDYLKTVKPVPGVVDPFPDAL
ncbi:MAG TPA: cytochrome c [Myxococcales bacterium]|nr:cytochrome c [Myxococcales bacterium]